MKCVVLYGIYSLLLCSFLQCTKIERNTGATGFNVTTQATLAAKNFQNITYGTHPRHKMDVYLPAGRNVLHTPLLILIHGGEWSKGDKSQMEYFINNLQHELKDFAFATINYRYVSGNSNLFPSQEEDIRAAIQKLRSLSDSFSVSGKYALLGESAGGHLALLQAFKNDEPGMRAVIALNAPSDLVEMYENPINNLNRSLLESVTGKTPQTSDIYYTSSPVNYVNNKNPSALLFHSTDDGFVDVKQSIALAGKLQAATVPNDLILLPGEKHVLSNAAYGQIFKSVVTFLKQPLLFR